MPAFGGPPGLVSEAQGDAHSDTIRRAAARRHTERRLRPVRFSGSRSMTVELGERFEAAGEMAHDLHRPPRRHGSPPPYLSHPLAVTSLVLEGGGDEDAAIAAVLHDAAEDQQGIAILAAITESFGSHVGAIVDACSDTVEYPRRPAIERKGRYIERLDN